MKLFRVMKIKLQASQKEIGNFWGKTTQKSKAQAWHAGGLIFIPKTTWLPEHLWEWPRGSMSRKGFWAPPVGAPKTKTNQTNNSSLVTHHKIFKGPNCCFLCISAILLGRTVGSGTSWNFMFTAIADLLFPLLQTFFCVWTLPHSLQFPGPRQGHFSAALQLSECLWFGNSPRCVWESRGGLYFHVSPSWNPGRFRKIVLKLTFSLKMLD